MDNLPLSAQFLSANWLDMLPIRLMECLVVSWVAFAAACVGSFLNVVVYRLPRGASVMFERSRCPRCGVAILAKDNVPILGWLLLEGRCRSCRSPIALRYPLVELGFAVLILVLFFIQLTTLGWNLPGYLPHLRSGLDRLVLYPELQPIGLFLFHSLLFAVIATWALIRWDGHRAPLRFYFVCAVLIGGLVLAWPELVPSFFGHETVSYLPFADRLLAVLPDLGWGLAAGCLVGLVACWLETRLLGANHADAIQVLGLTIILGLAYGWEALLVCGVMAIIIWSALQLLLGGTRDAGARHRLSSIAWFSAVVIHHFFWRIIHRGLSWLLDYVV